MSNANYQFAMQLHKQLQEQFAPIQNSFTGTLSPQQVADWQKAYGEPRQPRLSAEQKAANVELFNQNLQAEAKALGEAFAYNTKDKPIEEQYVAFQHSQEALKKQYAHLSEEQQNLALSAFNEQADVFAKADEAAGFLARTGDALSYIPSTLTKLGEQITGVVAPDGIARQWFKDATNEVESWRSDEAKLRSAMASEKMAQAKANGEWGVAQFFKNAAENPLETAGQFAESALPTIAAAIAGTAASPFTAGASLALPFAVGGLQSAGATRNEIYDHIMAMPQAQLDQSPEYQALLAQGMNADQARNELASSLKEHGGEVLATGVSGAALSGLGGLGRIGQVGKGALGSSAGKFASELVTEPADEVFQQFMGNKAINDIDQTHSLTSSLGEAAAGGLLFGAAGGAVAAADNAYRNRGAEAQQQAEVDSLANGAQTTAQAQNKARPASDFAPKRTVNERALENVLAGVPEEQRQAYFDELKSDLSDGSYEKYINENGTYSQLVRAYLAETGQAASETFSAKPNEAEAELQKSANTAPAAARNVLQGTTDSVDIGENNYQPVQYEVMEAADLAPTQQKAGNQLRDRDRAASQAQVTKIARNLDPRKLAESPTMEMGAPLLAQDGKTVIAGNGRSMAIRQAYQEGNADGYRQYLQTNAAKFGLDSNQIAAMANPVLVRRLNAAVDIKQTAINSNEQGGMRMSNLEQAKVDAGRLPNMAGFELGENGELNTAGNQHFISQFIRNQPETLRNELLDSRGNLSQTGVQRLRNAMLYHAYGDTDTLARAVESTDQGARNILNALTRIAPKVAQVKQDIAAGTLGDVDISGAIVAAVEKYNQLKSQNQDVGEYLQQQDFVSELAPEAKAVLRIFNENSRSAKRIGDILQSYYHTAEAQANTAQSTMFGEMALDKAGTLEQAKNTDDNLRYSRPKTGLSNEQIVNIASKRLKNFGNAILENKHIPSQPIDLGNTPQALVDLGAQQLPMVLDPKKIAQIVKNDDKQRDHNLSPDLLAQVPMGLQNPLAIFDSATEENAFVIVTELRDSENRPVIAAVHLNKKQGFNLVNKVASVYGKDEGENKFKEWTHNGLLRWTNPQKSQSVLTSFGLQSPTEKSQIGYTDNVQHSSPQINSFDPEIAQARETLRQALGEHADKIELVHSANLDKNERYFIQKRSAEGWFEQGKVVINLDNIQSSKLLSKEARLVWVGWHELAHNGIEVKFGKMLQGQLELARKNTLVKVLARKIQAERAKEGEQFAISDSVATEEAIVELFAAMETGNWAELESRYQIKIHSSWKHPQGDLARRLSHFVQFLKRLVASITGANTDTFTDAQVFELLKDVKRGIEMEGQNQQTAGVNASEIRHSFAGEKAQTANHSLLEQAKRAVQSGQNPETVRQQTGWFTGADGKWRFEIDDSQAQLDLSQFEEIKNGGSEYGTVGKFLKHSPLLSAYPEIEHISTIVNIDPTLSPADEMGRYTPYQDRGDDYFPITEQIEVTASTLEKASSILLHEIQHAIQVKEQFSNGGNQQEFDTKKSFVASKEFEDLDNLIAIAETYNQAPTEVYNLTKGTWNNEAFVQMLVENNSLSELIELRDREKEASKNALTPYEQYRRLSGEVEARNVQSRQHLTAEERLNRAPESTEDVARAEQIVRFNNGRSDFALREDPNSEFAKAVDRASRGYQGSNKRFVRMGTTPDVLKMVGLPDTTVSMREDVFYKVLSGGKHFLTVNDLKRLPEQINNPIAVTRSRTKDNGYLVFTELTERVDGMDKPVIAALHLKEKGNGLEVIDVASAYGRNVSQINEDLKQVLYWNKTKGYPFANRAGLQLPNVILSEDNLSKANIKTEADLSQYQSENSDSNLSETTYNQAKAEGKTELTFQQWKQVRSPEFKAWFGDWENDPKNASKVINPKTGEPLVVYHNSGTKGITEFHPFRGRAAEMSEVEIKTKLRDMQHKYLYEGRSLQRPSTGIWFTPFKDDYKGYGDIQYAVFLNIRNPEKTKVISKLSGGEKFNPNKPVDGVFAGYDEQNQLSPEIIVWLPSQIKSATDNNGQFSSENDDIRFSVKQTVDDLAQTGRARQEQSRLAQMKTWDGFKQAVKALGGYLDERVADGLRPVNDWIDELKTVGISAHEAERLKGDMYRAKGVRDALNSELEQAYLKPLIKKIAQVAKANKLDELSAKRLIGYWVSGRYAIEKNNALLKQEYQALLEAEKALADAKAKGGDIEQAAREYRAADRQYRGRKHDVELALNSTEDFQVGTAGGWSNAEAENFMRNIEQKIPRNTLEEVAEILYDLNQKRLEIDYKSGRYTTEQFNEYKQNRHYVPLTGDPNADEDFDGISGAGQNALNVSKDRALKGRKLSEAEDGIDASWRAISKSTTYAGWADFKTRIDDIYETKVAELVQTGYAEHSAREEVEKTLGISKAKMQGLTRSNDDVLIRKIGGVYYEYRLPKKAMMALKQDNVEHANDFLKLLSKPTGWYARGVTQWTVTFAPMNMLRDTWEKSEFIRVQKVYDRNGNLLDGKTMDKIGRGVLKHALYDKETWKAVKRFGFGQPLGNSASEQALKSLLQNGGLSSYSTYFAKTETDLVKTVKQQNSVLGKRLEQAGEWIGNYNRVFDTVSALSAYKSLIENGVDPKQAAAITLELTNFRKTGSKMRGIKALYMFSQPTAMGARNLIKYLSTPKGRHRFFGYMAVMMPLYAALRALDDDNEGGNKMDQLGDITRYIPLPMGLNKYLKIPVGFGMPQMAWNFSVNIVKAGMADISMSEAVTNMFVHSMKTFAPISPSEISAAKYPLEKLALTLTPTILQPLMQNVVNRSAFGNQITTNFVRDDKLKAEQAKSTTAQFWQDVALALNDTLGIDMHPEQIKNLFDGYGAMLGSLRELQTIFIENPNREQLGRQTRIPFLSQLIGTTNEFAIQSRYYEASEEAAMFAKRYESRKARGIVDTLSPAEQKMLAWHNLNKKRMGELRSDKGKLTRALREGKMSANVYEARIQAYNKQMDDLQRVLLKRWRQDQGLSTN